MRKIILAVDDEKCVLSSLGRIFRGDDYEFIPFNSPVKALEALDTIKPHIIISDKRMPHIEGVDFLTRAREILHCSFRILLTSFETAGGQLTGNVDCVIYKPWNSEQLLDMIRSMHVHPDRIVLPVNDFLDDNAPGCDLCGQTCISSEIRYHNYSDYVCSDCFGKMVMYRGGCLENMIIDSLLGNVI